MERPIQYHLLSDCYSSTLHNDTPAFAIASRSAWCSGLRVVTFHVEHHILFHGLHHLTWLNASRASLFQVLLELELLFPHLLGLLHTEVILE